MIIHECRSCKHWHGEFLCVCIESEFYHNPRLGADGCEQWVPYGAKSGEELLPPNKREYYHGMRNGFADLINAVREDTEPLTVDHLERLTEAALQAVLEAMIGINRCVCCGEIIPEGRQICPICGAKGGNNLV